MSRCLVSVIIPVYNVEKYITQTLDSLLNQTFRDYEVICIDDGSTDESSLIIEKYCHLDSRFKLIRQQNLGAAVARNNGIIRSNGKYLLFLDSDDYYDITTIEKVVCRAEETNSEIVVFDAFKFDDRTSAVDLKWRELKYIPNMKEVFSAVDIGNDIFNFSKPCPHNKMFLRRFITNSKLQFQNLSCANDLFFVCAAMSCARQISIVNEGLYYYRVNNENSLQGNPNRDPLNALRAIKKLKEWLLYKKQYSLFEDSFLKMSMETVFYNTARIPLKNINEALVGIREFDIFEKGFFSRTIDKVKPNSSVVIYGAGMMGRLFFTLCKMYFPEYDYELSVSNATSEREYIEGKEVKCINEIIEPEKKHLYVAVVDEKVQSDMEEIAREKGFKQITRLNFEMLNAMIFSE